MNPSADTELNESNGEKERRGIQSIEVGGQLLLALAAHGRPMPLRDLAKAAGMPAAKARSRTRPTVPPPSNATSDTV